METLKIKENIQSAYGAEPVTITPAKCGFSTKAAYRVTCADGTEYFLKVYDNTLPTTRRYVERINTYMPALARLSVLPGLNGRVLTPVMARSGGYRINDGSETYAMFAFVRGDVPGVEGITAPQTAELAETLALLHGVETSLYESPEFAEDISLSFLERFIGFLDGGTTGHGELAGFISPHRDILNRAIYETLRLRDGVREGYSPLVLCHGDAHGNNVIQSERLVLADWEDLHLAPAEADLFIHAWHRYGGVFLEAYCAARGGFVINRELLLYYELRRRLEDAWVDLLRLTEELPGAEETKNLLNGIKESINEIKALRRL